MPEELLLFGPIIAAAKAQAEQEEKFQAFCDEIVAASERHDARPRTLSNEQMRRLEQQYYADDGPRNAEELAAFLELQNKIDRATCPPEIRQLAAEIAAAIMPEKL